MSHLHNYEAVSYGHNQFSNQRDAGSDYSDSEDYDHLSTATFSTSTRQLTGNDIRLGVNKKMKSKKALVRPSEPRKKLDFKESMQAKRAQTEDTDTNTTETATTEENAATTTDNSNKPRLRTSEEVFNRLKWNRSASEQFNADQVTVGYLDRFEGVMEMPFTEFRAHEYNWMPFHRIQYFKHLGELIWDRKSRLDRVFAQN